MGKLVLENKYYIDKYDDESFRSFSHFRNRTSFESYDSYSTFFDYEKEKKMSEFLERFDEYIRSRHDDESPKTFIKKVSVE